MAQKNPAPATDASRFAPLTEHDVKAQTDDGSFNRGRTYFRQGHIVDSVLRDGAIEAQCHGSEYLPYRVQASLLPHGEKGENPRDVSCSCPRGGFCKHIVALLLTWVHNPQWFDTRPSVADLLAGKSRDDLVALIERMVQRYPDLEQIVEMPLPVSPGDAGGGSANEATIDAAVIRRQVRSGFVGLPHDGGDDIFGFGWGMVAYSPDVLESVLELGHSYAAAGQWANGQIVFTVLAEEVCEAMLTVTDHEGHLADTIAACDEGLAACLDAQSDLPEDQRLPDEARKRLIQTLYDLWHFDTFDIGGLDVSQYGPDTIARNATEYERSVVEEWLRDERGDGWSQRALTDFVVRLRQVGGLNDEEMLGIYREAELWDDVAGILLWMDRVDEAVATAARHLTEPQSLLSFANALTERGGDHVGRALALVDDRAWETEGANAHHDAMLQNWLVAQFSHHDRPRDALAMAQRRFNLQPTLQTYLAARSAAELPGQPPNTWADLRPTLIAHFREQEAWAALIDVYLEDGEVEAALDAFARLSETRKPGRSYGAPYPLDDRELRLANAAEQDFPDQAVSIYRQQAERRIELRQRSHYKIAAKHLARAKETLERHDREDEWKTLIDEVRTSNKTLRALREELDNLGLR